jgi:exodeoxyribonuclease VII small subunit
MEPDATTPPTGYAAALEELERILDELEDDAIDVDHLAQRVERAALLIRHCRDRLGRTRMEVERIVAELEHPDDATAAPVDDGHGG